MISLVGVLTIYDDFKSGKGETNVPVRTLLVSEGHRSRERIPGTLALWRPWTQQEQHIACTSGSSIQRHQLLIRGDAANQLLMDRNVYVRHVRPLGGTC